MSGFALGQTTLLLFQIGATAADSVMPHDRGTIPGHGPSPDLVNLLSSTEDGSTARPVGARMQISGRLNQHFCFAVPFPDDVAVWEQWLLRKDVKILGKVDWPRGGKSVYFSDLDGNVGEIGSRGIWEHY
jgi:hypothetical protein